MLPRVLNHSSPPYAIGQNVFFSSMRFIPIFVLTVCSVSIKYLLSASVYTPPSDL